MRRLLLVLLTTTALASLSVGSAASMRVSSENLTSGVYKDWGVAHDSVVTVECDLGGISLSFERSAGEPSVAHGVTLTGVDPICARTAVHVEVTVDDGSIIRARGVLSSGLIHVLLLDRPVALASVVDAEAMVVR